MEAAGSRGRSLPKGIEDVERIERDVAILHDRFASTWEALGAASAANRDRPAVDLLSTGERGEAPVTWTFGEMHAVMTRMANAFSRLGIGRRDAVALLLPNIPEMLAGIWAVQAVGIAAPINPFLETAQIASIVGSIEATVVVAPSPALFPEIWERAAALRQRFPSLRILTVGGTPPDGALDLHALMAAEPDEALVAAEPVGRDDIAAYFHTGGTTGAPKVAMLSHGNHLHTGLRGGLWLDLQPGERVLCGLPLFHVNAILLTGLAPLLRGTGVVILTPQGFRNPTVVRNFWTIVERHRPRFFSAVPTVYAALLQVSVADCKLAAGTLAFCGAAPMPTALIEDFERMTGITVVEGYGLTEGSCVSASTPPAGVRKAGAVGIRSCGQELRIVEVAEPIDPEATCGPDEVGLLIVRGPTVFKGYKAPASSEGVLLAGGWLNTGDLARIDADGYVFLAGRQKDLIIRGGHNIDPALIEEALQRHPAVHMAAAVGRPDAYAGELPIAFVALRPGQATSGPDLCAFAMATITERAAVPVDIIVLPDLPVTAVGKISKLPLRALAISGAYEAALRDHGIEAIVTVGNEPSRGTVAVVRPAAAADSARIAPVLDRFAVPYRVAGASSAPA